MAEITDFNLPEPVVLNIGGEKFLWHFNNYALVELGHLTKSEPFNAHIALQNVAKRDVIQGLAYLLYAGLVGYEKMQGNFDHGIEMKKIAGFTATANINDFAPLWDAFKASTDMGEFLVTLRGKEDKDAEKSVKKK